MNSCWGQRGYPTWHLCWLVMMLLVVMTCAAKKQVGASKFDYNHNHHKYKYGYSHNAAGSGYDPVQGANAMYYSAAAYCDPLALLTWSCGLACQQNQGIFTVRPIAYAETKSFTYGYVTYNTVTKTIVVAFRGTNGVPSAPDFRTLESFLNWETNLSFKQTLYLNMTGVEVHQGFLDSYQSVQSQVRSSVKALLKGLSGSTVLVTGHSLGGALATLAALDLRLYLKDELSPSQVQLYTFGSPRVGNAKFVDYFFTLFAVTDVYRVINANDVVPHVPSLVQNFVHVGTEVWYTSDQQYRQCAFAPPVYEDPTCSDALLQYGIAAHLSYLGSNITNLCPIQCPPGQCLGCPVDNSNSSHSLNNNRKYQMNIIADQNNGQQRQKRGSTSSTSSSSAVEINAVGGDPNCPHCDVYGCNQTTGICNHYCDDATKWWGLKCDKPCLGNCDVYGCNKDSGKCNHYCSDATKWWGVQCDQPCLGHCDNYGCNKDTGLCNHYCSDARQWWGVQCDQQCGGHCDVYGCNKDTGYCNHYCADATKWWEPKCCSNQCTGNCDVYGCNIDTGLCNHYCNDARKWWGPHCDQQCQGHCDVYGCNMQNGVCNHYCDDATKWWGVQCDQKCEGHCDVFGCNKDTGLCNHSCNGKWWGPHCENSCANCDVYGCNKDTGACNHQ